VISQNMDLFRNQTPSEIAGHKLINFTDLAHSINGLPATDGVKFWLGDNARILIRPSGTEPKIKCYIEVIETGEISAAKKQADSKVAALRQALTKVLVG
jgi:phosphomannomutase